MQVMNDKRQIIRNIEEYQYKWKDVSRAWGAWGWDNEDREQVTGVGKRLGVAGKRHG
jgi:hypothetical protein